MKITVIQQDIAWKDVETNIANLEKLVRNAEKADLYLFPEMCSTGFCMQPQGVAEDVDGVTVRLMKRLAAEYDAAMVVPVMTHEGGKYYNRMYFITPEGVAGHYDKNNLFEYSGEDKVFTHGTETVIWQWRGVRFRPAICYDLRFPAFLYNRAQYDVLLISANFPDSRLLAWDTLVRARAIENQVYVLATDQTGKKPKFEAYGHSMVIDPWGTILTEAGVGETILYAEIDLDREDDIRRQIPCIFNRRKDLY